VLIGIHSRTSVGSEATVLGPAKSAVCTLADFTINHTDATVTCPNGVTRPIAPGRTVTFVAICDGCPLRAPCAAGKKGRTVKVHNTKLFRVLPAAPRKPRSSRRFTAGTPTQGGTVNRVAHPRVPAGPVLGSQKNDHWLHHPRRRAEAATPASWVWPAATEVGGAAASGAADQGVI